MAAGVFFLFYAAVAQTGPAELMAGDKYMHYQHSLAQSFSPESRTGWQHIATLIKRYDKAGGKTKLADELMNQVYITAQLSPVFSVKGGLFYTNIGGFKPSAGIQVFIHKKNWRLLLSPRADIAKKASYELFTMAEFTPVVAAEIKLYIRLQAMSNAGVHHNRSYQLLRLGIERKGFQYGAGITTDEYGTNGIIHVNTGVFIRKLF